MKIQILITILLGWSVFSASRLTAQVNSAGSEPRGSRLQIEDLVLMAIENNAALQAHRLRYEATQARVPQAAALPDAKIGFGYFAVPVETRLGPQQATLSFSQSFPWFGTLGAQEDAAEAYARQHAQTLADARNRIVMDVRSAYYALHLNEHKTRLLEEHQKLLTSLRALALVRYEAGSIPFSHLLRLDMELENLSTQIGYARDSREPLLEGLVRRVNREISFDELLLPEVLEFDRITPEDGKDIPIVESNPRLKTYTEERTYWETRGEAARRQGYPAFTLGLTYIAIGPRGDASVPDNGRDAILPQVGLSFPLLGSRYSAMEEEAQLRGRAAQAAQEDTRRQLLAEYAVARRDLTDARRRLHLAERLTALSRSTYDVLVQEYSAGAASLEEVLAVERDILRYDLDEVSARADIARMTDRIMYLTAQE